MTEFVSRSGADRFEDHRFLTGTGRYVADVNLPGQLHMAVLRSPHGHAHITNIDCAAAAAMPGVVAVCTGADLAADGIRPLPCVARFPATRPLVVPPRPALADKRVRHVGDPVAMVVAESAAAAVSAAEQVEVDYRPLASVINGPRALAEGAPQIWDEAPGNIAYRFEKGDRDAVLAALAGAAHQVELEIVNNRVMAAPIEPRAGIASIDPTSGALCLLATIQGVHAVRRQLAQDVFGVDEAAIQVSAPDVGGGFGQKNFLYPEWVLLLWAARRLRRPVKWVAERGEDHAAAAHGRDIVTRARLGLDADGRILALHAELTANMGAYLSPAGPGASTTAAPTAMGGIYRIPAIYMQTTGVFTNQTPVDAYRGAGKPEANFIIERLIEVAARRCGFDPVELRLINAIDRFPHVTAQGTLLDCGRFRANIEDAVKLAGRAEFPERRRQSERRGRLRGLGFGCFLETSRGTPMEGAEVRFSASGRIELRVGTESNGQGHETAYPVVAGQRLGVDPAVFDYIQADTALTRTGYGHGGARSMHMGVGTMVLTLDRMLDKAGAVAATLLQTGLDRVQYSNGRFTVEESGRTVGLWEVAEAARDPAVAPDLDGEGLDTFTLREGAPFTFPNGCHAAEVEIDPETGAIEILRYIMVDDYGMMIMPAAVEGQVHGGVAQGIGQALAENAAYDIESGQFIAGSLMDYTLPRATLLPAFLTRFEPVPTNANRIGVKGVGQAGAIAAPQTIINAIVDALASRGVDHIQMPATSEAIWRALRAASSA